MAFRPAFGGRDVLQGNGPVLAVARGTTDRDGRHAPHTLALIDSDLAFAGRLAEFLRGHGVAVRGYADSNNLLIDPAGYDHGFYLLDLALPGVGSLDLIKPLRRRSRAGFLVVLEPLSADRQDEVISGGAGMYLSKPAQFEQVLLTVKAVNRRVVSTGAMLQAWRLDRRARDLVTPDGVRVALSDAELQVLERFLASGGAAVSRETLLERQGRDQKLPGSDGLNAAIHRLRGRTESAAPTQGPLQARPRFGYVFKAPLQVI